MLKEVWLHVKRGMAVCQRAEGQHRRVGHGLVSVTWHGLVSVTWHDPVSVTWHA
jgi:hypothetical protein